MSFAHLLRSSIALDDDKSFIKKLPTRLEETRIKIPHLREQLYLGKGGIKDERHVHFVPLEDCIRSAEKFVSTAAAKVNARSDEVVDATITSITKSTAELSLSTKPDLDLETLLIQNWEKSVNSKIADGDYKAAEVYLGKILKRSEAVYGKESQRNCELLEQHATVYSKLWKLNEAEKVLFDLLNNKKAGITTDRQRWRIMSALAEVYFGKYDYANARKFCQQVIQGTKKQSFKTVIDLLFAKPRTTNTTTWSQQVTKEIKAATATRNESFENSDLFYNAVNLLSQIHEAKGEAFERECCSSLLPPDYSTMSLEDRC